MRTDTESWWPSGGPWSRWRAYTHLEDRREAWTGEFFGEVSRRPDVAAMFGLEAPPDMLRLAAIDEVHGGFLKKLNGSRLVVKVCARRLPGDPTAAGLSVLDCVNPIVSDLRGEARERPLHLRRSGA